MATSGQMVDVMAEVFGLPVSKVETLDRRLSDHGLRTKGGRGKSAAHMVALDVANLTIAIMSGAGMMEAPATTAAITNMKRGPVWTKGVPDQNDDVNFASDLTAWQSPHRSDLDYFPFGYPLTCAATFGEAVAVFVDGMATDQLKLSDDMTLSLTITNAGPMATINFQVKESQLKILFGAYSAREALGLEAKPVIEQTSILNGITLEALAEIIRTA